MTAPRWLTRQVRKFGQALRTASDVANEAEIERAHRVLDAARAPIGLLDDRVAWLAGRERSSRELTITLYERPTDIENVFCRYVRQIRGDEPAEIPEFLRLVPQQAGEAA